MLDKRQELIERYPDQELLFCDGYDDAILGFDETNGRVIYSVNRIIDIICASQGDQMTLEDAWEHFYFNIEGSFMGDLTPIYCYDFF